MILGDMLPEQLMCPHSQLSAGQTRAPQHIVHKKVGHMLAAAVPESKASEPEDKLRRSIMNFIVCCSQVPV